MLPAELSTYRPLAETVPPGTTKLFGSHEAAIRTPAPGICDQVPLTLRQIP